MALEMNGLGISLLGYNIMKIHRLKLRNLPLETLQGLSGWAESTALSCLDPPQNTLLKPGLWGPEESSPSSA